MPLLIKIIIAIALFLMIFSLLTFFMSIHPKKIITGLNPADYGHKYEEITFRSSDGVKLSGWFMPSNKTKKTIIIMHGYPADKANLVGIADFLAKDFNIFLFDFRSFGKSDGFITTVGYKEKNDLQGAIDYLEKEKNLTNIGLYGFSLGGAVALMTNHKNVKAIVTDSAYAELSHMVEQMYMVFSIFRYPLVYLTKLYSLLFLSINIDKVSPLDNISKIDVPLLLIHAGKDSQIPVNEAHLLHKANNKSELWIVENVDHGASHSVDSDKYEKRVIEFFGKNIK